MLTKILSLLFSVAVVAAHQASLPASSLHIYWIDVEGGGATLVVTPAGEAILVDAGWNLDRDASRIHDVAVGVAGVNQIDYFVATHWHADHYGGAIALSKRMQIKRFFGNGPLAQSVPDDPQFPALMPLYRDLVKDTSVVLRPGDKLAIRQPASGPPLQVQVIASGRKLIGSSGRPATPNPLCSEKEEAKSDPSQNADSVVLLFQYGSFTFFDGGDLTRAVEQQLVCPINLVGDVELFQIDHHGFDLSNPPVLIHSLHPRVVVVNNGPQKGAEPKTMKTLFSTPSIETVWQVHRNLQAGDHTNTKPEFIANQQAENGSKAEFIQATAEPGGALSIQIGERGTRKSYLPR